MSGSAAAPGAFVPLTADLLARAIPDAFAAQVARHPDRIAVTAPGSRLSYRELDAAAARVAAALEAGGVEPGQRVALLVDHAPEAIVAVLGALQLGAVVVALDPALPEARLRAIVDDADPALVAADARGLAIAQRLAAPGRPVLDLGRIPGGAARTAARAPIPPDALGFLIYTSGTTGAPKGVMQTHANILRGALGLTNGLAVTAEDRLTLFAHAGVGQGVTTVFLALVNGARLCMWNPRALGVAGLADWLAGEGITIYSSAATIFRQLADTLVDRPGLLRPRVARLASEPVRGQDVTRCRACFGPDCVVHTTLSTTETMNATLHLVPSDEQLGDTEGVPVGRPVYGVDVQVLDDGGDEVPAGAVGEIVIRGRHLSPGYWRRPGETAAVFAAGADGMRTYRTGDLGRRRPDGTIVHVGRRDFRVKVRGVRVELEEVERALVGAPGVSAAAVEARIEDDDARLVAYLVARGAPPSIIALRDHLAPLVPAAAVPSEWIFLDAMPVTPNGKLDRRALAACTGRRPTLGTPFAAPESPLEQTLAALWAEVLRLERVGRHDGFFDLGGTSLSAMRLIIHTQSRFGVEVPIERLFLEPTLAAFALTLVELERARPAPGAPTVSEPRRPGLSA